MRFVAHINPTKSEAAHLSSDTEVSFLPMEAVGEDGSVDLSRTKSIADVFGGYTYFRDGDVLIAKITPCFENGKATRVDNLTNGLGFGSTEFHVLRARKELSTAFLLHLVRSAPFRDLGTASMYGAGGQKRVPTDFVADFMIPLPPPAEQTQIATFLDRETAKIDALIAKQTEFLTRLDEHRRALITDAVTRGLNASVPTQNTICKQFPAIPMHWNLKLLMHLVSPSRPINYGVLMPGPRLSDGVPLIEAGDIMAGDIKPQELRRTSPDIELLFARSRLKPGDIVVAIRGSIGAASVVPAALTNANVTRDAARISPRAGIDSQFLAYVLGSEPLYDFYAHQSLGAAVQGINISDLKRAPIPVPPYAEQKSIAQHLSLLLDKLRRTSESGTRMIALLSDRRAALITAAVTGQIDVTQPALAEAAA